MAIVLLDSSIFIAILNAKDSHHTKVLEAFESDGGNEFRASVITYTELLSSKSGLVSGGEIIEDINSLVSGVIEISSEVAIEAGKLRAIKGLGAADALIASCAQSIDAEVWTTDKKFASKYKPSKYLG